MKLLRLLVAALVLACVTVFCGCSNSDAPKSWAKTEEAKKHPGRNTYRKYCRSCHQGGLSGSPVFGDKEAWEPRIEKGRDVLLASTIEGMPPGMPIKGLCGGCTDEELEQAIDYMVKAVEAQVTPEEQEPSEEEAKPEEPGSSEVAE